MPVRAFGQQSPDFYRRKLDEVASSPALTTPQRLVELKELERQITEELIEEHAQTPDWTQGSVTYPSNNDSFLNGVSFYDDARQRAYYRLDARRMDDARGGRPSSLPAPLAGQSLLDVRAEIASETRIGREARMLSRVYEELMKDHVTHDTPLSTRGQALFDELAALNPQPAHIVLDIADIHQWISQNLSGSYHGYIEERFPRRNQPTDLRVLVARYGSEFDDDIREALGRASRLFGGINNRTRRELAEFAHPKVSLISVNGVTIRTGKAVAGVDGAVGARFFAERHGAPHVAFEGSWLHEGLVQARWAISPDGRYVAACDPGHHGIGGSRGNGGQCRVWDTQTGKVVRDLEAVNAIAFVDNNTLTTTEITYMGVGWGRNGHIYQTTNVRLP